MINRRISYFLSNYACFNFPSLYFSLSVVAFTILEVSSLTQDESSIPLRGLRGSNPLWLSYT